MYGILTDRAPTSLASPGESTEEAAAVSQGGRGIYHADIGAAHQQFGQRKAYIARLGDGKVMYSQNAHHAFPKALNPNEWRSLFQQSFKLPQKLFCIPLSFYYLHPQGENAGDAK